MTERHVDASTFFERILRFYIVTNQLLQYVHIRTRINENIGIVHKYFQKILCIHYCNFCLWDLANRQID